MLLLIAAYVQGFLLYRIFSRFVQALVSYNQNSMQFKEVLETKLE